MDISDLLSANFIGKVNKILEQVKDHVEFLYLGAKSLNGDLTTGPIDVQIPKVKKLKEFGNSALDLFTCGDKLQNICTARIPTLQRLRLSQSYKTEEGLDHILRNIIEEEGLFSGIKYLRVENLHALEVIAGLKTPFPNLENLSIYQSDKISCPFIGLEPYLKAYSSLGLKFLEMELANVHGENFSHFIQGFSNCGELLSGLYKQNYSYAYRVV